jgi:hypothetical protein
MSFDPHGAEAHGYTATFRPTDYELVSRGVRDYIGRVRGVVEFTGEWDLTNDTNVRDFIGEERGVIDFTAAVLEGEMGATHPVEEVFQGNTWYLRWTNFKADGTRLDLTGCTITWTLMDDRGDVVMTKSSTDGSITVADAPNGIDLLTVPAADTDIPLGRYRDKHVVTSSGVVSTTCVGELVVKER